MRDRLAEEMMMTFRERIEWLFRMGLLVFVLAAAAFLSAVMAMRFAIQGRQVDMPNLVGKSSADAQAILQGRGLQLKIVDRVYSTYPVNTVARQTPPAGEAMKISQDAHVVLSLGPQNVTIPAMTGESLRVARIQLLQVGLQLGEVTSYSTPSIAFDGVLQQDPPSGTKATTPRVDLLVAEPAPAAAFVMPWLVGMPWGDAERLLSSGGVKISKITNVPSPQWPKGDVIEQMPEQGSKIMGETAVELVVAQ
ncbi:MAG: PASTA domain-containing protein [Acidobacteriia bacterium]|nr:PASTA domain-containing protein [Terriglobia bacterium]